MYSKRTKLHCLFYTTIESGEKKWTNLMQIRYSVIRETANLSKTSALFLDLPAAMI